MALDNIIFYGKTGNRPAEYRTQRNSTEIAIGRKQF